MANETFKDASGTTKYRKSSGAGNSGDPAVTHVNVDTLPALAAGTNAIGKLTANSGVDIGDVDVTSLPGTWSVNLSGATFPTLTVSSHNVTNAGTFAVQAVCTNAGTFAVQAACTNAGTFAVQVDGAALTSLQLIDDAVSTTGSAITAKGMTACGTDGTNARALKTDASGELQVDVLSSALPTGAATETSLASVLAALGGALTYKYAVISAASSGENTLVAAVTSKKIRVLACFLMSTGTVNAYFNNATAGAICADGTNKLALIANVGFVLPFNPAGWFQTGTNNEALRLNLSGAVGVAGCLVYAEV